VPWTASPSGQLAGYLLDHGAGYGSIFALVSTFHVLAFGLILLMIRTVRPLEFQELIYVTGATPN
jgi:ACS family hexuronate transporter-like MFS transporter